MKISGHVSFWIFILMALMLVVFCVQNPYPVEVLLIFKKTEVSLSILLMATFLAGLIAGIFYARAKPKANDPAKNSADLKNRPTV